MVSVILVFLLCFGEVLGASPSRTTRPSRLMFYGVDEIRADRDFEGKLRTFVSVVGISTDNPHTDEVFTGPCGSAYKGFSINFKSTVEDRPLWYASVRFKPRSMPFGKSLANLKSKVEIKCHLNPDAYREVYGCDFECRTIAAEGTRGSDVYFRVSDGFSTENSERHERRRVFEWPIGVGLHFQGPITSFQLADRVFNHTTLQDVINGINTLRTHIDGATSYFPLYTLTGVAYSEDAINCCGFTARSLVRFGIPVVRSEFLRVYLNHEYAARHSWYLSYLFKGPSVLKPEIFIREIRAAFFAAGRDAVRGREFLNEEVRTIFSGAY
jgi:hypothetical protein